MSDVTDVVTKIFEAHNINIPASRKHLFNGFIHDESNLAAIDLIIQNQNRLMGKWKMKERIADIMGQTVRILNASVGKSYEAKVDFEKWGWNDIKDFEFAGLEEAGLLYDEKTKQITGVPIQSGDIPVQFKFKIEGQDDDEPFNEKIITLIINPDPKSLWKTLESDKSDPYWKEDDVTEFAPINDRHIVVSCKRGRSHANVGSFREDHHAFKDLVEGWSIVVVSDGAGSAKISRKGSALACTEVIKYFSEPALMEGFHEFDELVQDHVQNAGEETEKKIKLFAYNNLGKAVFYVHKKLEEFAKSADVPLKDLNNTLVFALFKKYDVGYAFLSFGVGDCPMAVLDKDIKEVKNLSWIDVGEFGGGTRFITMPEIFKSDKFSTRFDFHIMEDFSYLILMSDGIYDPKFVVESSLPDIKKWKAFLEDLNGKNEDKIRVDLNPENKEITTQLSQWMDFWSPGNHDDRTLAIVF